MLRGWFGIAPGDDERCACDKIAKKLTSDGGERDKGYSDLCWMLALPVEQKQSVEDEPMKHRGFDAVSRLIGRASRRAPVVMIFEDLHWLDDASREILEKAVAHAGNTRMMIVTTHRPEYKPSWQTTGAYTQLRSAVDEATRRESCARGRQQSAGVEADPAQVDGNRSISRADALGRGRHAGGARRADRRDTPPGRDPDSDTIGEVLARASTSAAGGQARRQVASVLGRQFRRGHLGR
jgi:hypothetical protein